MKTVFLASLLLLAIAVPPAGAADSADPVLGAIAAKGEWRILEPVRTFGPDTLYEEIDGEAELVLPYGMERLTVAVLGRTAKPGSEVRLELYRMASSRDAYGIWSQYRHPDQEVLRIPPAEAIVSDTSADFFRGDTFVRIRSKPGGGSRNDVVGISSEIVALIKGSGAPPEEARALDGLPGTVSGSILYQKRAMLGYECLSPGFEAKFSTTAASGHYLLLPPAADGGSGRRARFARELPAYREVNPALSAARIPSGNVWMTSEGGCVLAVAGKIDERQAEPLLSSFARRLQGICRSAP
ncbi:MAG: hypothetical protein H6Q82_1617 [Deltaproteobacteria bacterium]|nr:hypothetical protein [Deltaproteobacteria bacterium]MBP2683744.1 hypothetical protein [Deltaproteobacteria bacterium]MBP2686436.1 hypothetical protein [Deltaproteobacteria bacterium]